MTKATLKNVNARLRKEGLPIEFDRIDNAYHIFIHDTPVSHITISVMVPHTSQCSVDWWVAEARSAWADIQTSLEGAAA